MLKGKRNGTATSGKTKAPTAPRTRKPRSAAPQTTVAPEAVAQRAYALFLEEGQRHGADQAHWFRAEQELSTQATGTTRARRGDLAATPVTGTR